jgi:spoIIIJ-associated protein
VKSHRSIWSKDEGGLVKNMMNGVEKTAKTIDEAINLALLDLNLDRELADIEVIEEGSKGIFGFLGGKPARVKVKAKKEASFVKGKEFVEKILHNMKVEATVKMEVLDQGVVIRITGEDVGILIGRRGETLESLQYLASLVVNRNSDRYQKVTVDIEGYRDRREDTLIKLAQRIASKVARTNKSVILEPMTPYERRIIHSTLQNNGTVATFSTGDEPYRKIIVKPK